MALAHSASAQSNVFWPNDDCDHATPIAGDGAFVFDTSYPGLNTSPPALAACSGCSCGTTFVGIEADLWYLWTATCTGVVQMRTGTSDDPLQCNQDTVLAVYNAPCPAVAASLIACCDDACAAIPNTCDLSSYVAFDVACGEQYLVRVGRKPGTPGGYGTLKIECIGKPCPGLSEVCDDCCGAKPHFNDPIYAANYTGQVAVMTGNDFLTGGSPYPVVTIFNLDCTGSTPMFPQEWAPSETNGPPSNAFRYTRSNWTKNDLGSVFGLTLDSSGNIYVAHAGFYGTLVVGVSSCIDTASAIGQIAGSSSTSIHRISSGSGTPQVFANLPMGTASETDPGLGDVTYDCEHSTFYASHFGDGRIYRINQAGTILGWFDHATNAIGIGSAPEPGAPYTDFVPLGERVWAVHARDGRLYYSVWGQNKDIFCPTNVVGKTPNRVWSVGLDAAGAFVANSRQQELQPPIHPGNYYAPSASSTSCPSGNIIQFSSPISDIDFSAGCRMLLAERDMSIGNCTLAHAARALEYSRAGSSWLPSNHRGGYGYEIGQNDANLRGTNSAGGCAYDFGLERYCSAGRAWITGDALVYNSTGGRVYGFTGVETSTAFGYATALNVDYNANYSNGSFDKTKQGDIEIPCPGPPPCMEVVTATIECLFDENNVLIPGQYTWTVTLTNKSGVTANSLSILAPGFSPNPVLFTPNGLADGASSVFKLTLTNASPGPASFPFVLFNSAGQVCCTDMIDIEIPDCDCVRIFDETLGEATCINGLVTFDLDFILHNLYAPFPIAHVFLIPLPAGSTPVTITPDYFSAFTTPPLVPAPIPLWGTAGLQVTVANVTPGSAIQVEILVHAADFHHCCSEIVTILAPECPGSGGSNCCCESGVPGGLGCDDAGCTATVCAVNPFCCDINWDFICCEDAQILCKVCQPGSPDSCDLNGDGLVNGADLAIVLGNWGLCAGCPADINGDGVVDGADLAIVLGNWTG